VSAYFPGFAPRRTGRSAYDRPTVHVLITGVSGSGKSSLVHELRGRGFLAVDADDDGFTEPGPDGAWRWRVDKVQRLLDEHGDRPLFFAGCSDEQARLRFDHRVLLTAPVDLIVDRLRTRTTNAYGKTELEIDRILAEMQWVVPLLQASADLTVETTVPVGEVADCVVAALVRRP
jgi:GTPase SAR1 family protein